MQLDELIQQVRSGEDAALRDLVRCLRRDAVEPATLVTLLHSPEESLRRAAIAGAQGRSEADVLEALDELAHDLEPEIRQSLADAAREAPLWLEERTLEKLLYDDETDVRLAAVEAARWRRGLEATLINRLSQDDSWRVRQSIAWSLATATPRETLPPLVTQLGEDGDTDVQRACATSIEKHLVTLGGYPIDLPRPPVAKLQEAQQRVAGLTAVSCPRLLHWLNERVAREIDVEPLKAFGTVLTLEADAGRLPHAHHVDRACEEVKTLLTGEAPRAVVLLGESGTGKTAIVHELAHRLLADSSGAWHVLRIAPGEFLSGTTYVGEWETKLKNIIQSVCHPRRVVLYVPNLQELTGVGTTSKSDLNVATMIAPYLERGDVAMLGESTHEAFRTGLGANLPLRRLFHTVEVRPAPTAQTRAILQAVREESGADVPDAMLDRIMELADYYLAGSAQPGRAVGLLRRVLGMTADREGPISERDVLGTMSTSTGIPVDFLDDTVPLDRAQLRGFFDARVMGQPEAVDAVVDVATLIKAGLTDPNKPFGVLLFVGPTGVGKTEMARSLAELLFGDPARMLRIDMSEYASYDAFERLIGKYGQPGVLTSPVRERPFSVVLLDEFEKGNINVFDLCLQIFDAGRLTDGQGRTTDFRRTIIILTSNVGSVTAKPTPVGFKPVLAPAGLPAALDSEALLRELGRYFRPEFLNRLDRIVQFRPLDAETAEKIARREVQRVLERSGISRRRLVVDVDPAVIPLLLREGYSPTFGARPLKRTVERLVLLPLARAITGGELRPGSVLRLVARGSRVDVQIAEAEATDVIFGGEPERPPAPQAVSVADRTAGLLEYVAALREQAAPLAARKSELLTQSARPDFWNNREEAQALYDEVFRIDGVLAQRDDLERQLREVAEAVRARRITPHVVEQLSERLEVLESHARHVTFLVGCREPRELGDALVTLTLVASHGIGLDAVATVARMYVKLAERRGLQVRALDDHQGGDPPEDGLVLALTGVGAYALLAGESGLHQLARGRREGRDGRRRPVDRDVVRVEVFPMLAGPPLGADEVRAETQPLNGIRGRLVAQPRYEVRLLHLPTMVSVRGWTDGSKTEAVERFYPLLRARVEASRCQSDASPRPPVVRRYSLGPATLVRDVRSGRTSGRLDQVLSGHLDLFLAPPGAGETSSGPAG